MVSAAYHISEGHTVHDQLLLQDLIGVLFQITDDVGKAGLLCPLCSKNHVLIHSDHIAYLIGRAIFSLPALEHIAVLVGCFLGICCVAAQIGGIAVICIFCAAAVQIILHSMAVQAVVELQGQALTEDRCSLRDAVFVASVFAVVLTIVLCNCGNSRGRLLEAVFLCIQFDLGDGDLFSFSQYENAVALLLIMLYRIDKVQIGSRLKGMGKGDGICAAYGLGEAVYIPCALLEVCIGSHTGGNRRKCGSAVYTPLTIFGQGNIADLICAVGAIPGAVDHLEGDLFLIHIGNVIRLIALFTDYVGSVNHTDRMVLYHIVKGVSVPTCQSSAVGSGGHAVNYDAIQCKTCFRCKAQFQISPVDNGVNMGSIGLILTDLGCSAVYNDHRDAML